MPADLRLDDKELICFSYCALFLYFDPMSRMAVWKQRFGSDDQAEYLAGIRCKQCDELRDTCWAGIEGAGIRGASQRRAGQKTAS